MDSQPDPVPKMTTISTGAIFHSFRASQSSSTDDQAPGCSPQMRRLTLGMKWGLLPQMQALR